MNFAIRFEKQCDQAIVRRSFHPLLLTLWLLIQFINLPSMSAQEAEPKTDAGEKIERAARDLESSKFSTREGATRELWKMGLPATDALEAIVQTGSADARIRASRLLADFRVGILPTTALRDRELINAFRHGTPKTRVAMFPNLLAELPMQWIQGLIVTERQPDFRRRYLLLMLSDREILNTHNNLEAIVEVVRRSDDGMNATWRRDTVSMLLSTPPIIDELLRNGKLPSIEKYITDLPDAERVATVTVFCQNAQCARSLIVSGHRDFLLTLLQQAGNDATAAKLAMDLFSHPVVVGALAVTNELTKTLDELETRFGENNTQLILIAMLQ